MSSDLPTELTATAKCSSSCTTTRSLFALALHEWSQCVFLVVLVALLLLSPAAVLILLPVACMLVSLCLLCAIAALLIAPFVPVVPPCRAFEHRGGGECGREQDCIEVYRDEAPGGGDGDASSAEEEHGEELFSNSCDDEQRRVFFVDTGSYCRTFYDLLTFWRSMERQAPGGERNDRYT